MMSKPNYYGAYGRDRAGIYTSYEKLKREYPGTVTLDGKVPKWYFDEKMMIEKIERRN